MSHSPSLTIVMGIRNRAGERLERCLASLEAQTLQDFRVILVDYGSDPEQALAIRRIAERFSFCDYIYSETRGYPWNRSRALNIGGRMADSSYLMTTDVDVLFPKKFLEIALDKAGQGKVLHCRPIYLPPQFQNWKNFEDLSDKAGLGEAVLGMCQIIETNTFHSARGFDETFEYWGVEDRDFNQRLTRLGVKTEWLNDWTVIYHQWHPKANHRAIGAMPDGYWGRVNAYYHVMQKQTTRNSPDWGRLYAIEERPVFSFLDLEQNRLRERNDLHFFDAPPDNNKSVGLLLDEFFQLPVGHALAVMQADYPNRSALVERAFKNFNQLFDKTRAGFHIGYTRNLLHGSVAEFIERNPNLIRDYYLNFPAAGGVTILVRDD